MALAFASGGGGGGSGVASVTAADTSIVVGGTAANPTVATGTLDVIAADHPPAAAVPLNAQKITGLANGTAATDAAAFGQIPAAGLVKIFDSTLGADAASIGTGANAIPGTYSALMVVSQLRTAAVAATDTAKVTLNGDAGANYDQEVMSLFTNASTSFGATAGITGWSMQAHGSGGAASYAATAQLFIPNYAGTTFFKAAQSLGGIIDSTTGNTTIAIISWGWRSTAAINQMTFTGAGGNLKAGSRVAIYGLP